jgi:hypothetical protein
LVYEIDAAPQGENESRAGTPASASPGP